MKTSLIIISVSFFITIILSVLYSLKHNTASNGFNSFRLYYRNTLKKIGIQSNNAGKQNGPFLECDIFQTIDDGINTMNAIGNMFEGISNYDSEPRW